MNKAKKALAAGLSLTCVISAGSCGSGGGRAEVTGEETTVADTAEYTKAIDFDDLADIEEIDTKNEEGTGPLYEPGKKAGTIKGLCYYDFSKETSNLSVIFAERFGGTIEMNTNCNSLNYFEKLTNDIAAGLSPDLVRYEWMAFPYGVYNNLFTPLDGWLDMDSPVWSDEKGIIEQFAFNGKHYYYPQNVMPHFCIIYSRESVKDAGLPDPMDLLDEGNWNWNTFEDMMKKWSAQGDDYIGVRGAQWSALALTNTTGTKVMEFTADSVINNMKDINVQRTMEWVENLHRQGLIPVSEWVDPSAAFLDEKLLFLTMGWEWGFSEAQAGDFKPDHVLDRDFAFVPFPKDPQSDKYYIAGDSVGYMVPVGAENIQGGVQYILSSRINETDPEVVAAERAHRMDTSPVYADYCLSKYQDEEGKTKVCKYDYVKNGTEDLRECPECGSPRNTVFKDGGYYDERQLDVLADMTDPDKYTLIYDSSYGLGKDFEKIFISNDPPSDSLYDGPYYHGSSYTQIRETYYNVIEEMLNEQFRSKLQS